MSRESTLILVGVLVALAPFSGLPHSWLAVILPFLGIVAGGIGYALRREHVNRARAEEEGAAAAVAALAAEALPSPYAPIESTIRVARSRVS
jgi:hypothetical protein